MTSREELARKIAEAIMHWIQSTPRSNDHPETYELRLASVVLPLLPEVGGGVGGPRCPKCKSLALTHFNFNAKAPGQPFVRCCECFEVYPIRDLADFAQFFPASSTGEGWAQRAYETLAAINLAVEWELAPSIKKHIATLIDSYPFPPAPEGKEKQQL